MEAAPDNPYELVVSGTNSSDALVTWSNTAGSAYSWASDTATTWTCALRPLISIARCGRPVRAVRAEQKATDPRYRHPDLSTYTDQERRLDWRRILYSW